MVTLACADATASTLTGQTGSALTRLARARKKSVPDRA